MQDGENNANAGKVNLPGKLVGKVNLPSSHQAATKMGAGNKADVSAYPHVYDESKVSQVYINSVDNKLVDFVDYVLSNEGDNKTKFFLEEPSKKLLNNIKKITGIDVLGFKQYVKTNSIRHILRDHGANGITDNSMADVKDIARMAYVLNEFDNIELLDTKSVEYRDKNQKPTPLIKVSKRIDGTYYVVQAVPDTNAKSLAVVSAYIEKAPKQQTENVRALSYNAQNDSADFEASGNMLAQPSDVVKLSDMGKVNLPKKAVGKVNLPSSPDIYMDMPDNERAEVLKNKVLNVVEYRDKGYKLSDDEVATLESKYKSKASKILLTLCQKFGLFKAYSNDNIGIEFNYSKASVSESIHNQSIRYPNYADFGKMLGVFDDIVKNAQPIEIHSDKYIGTRRENQNLKQVYVLLSAFKVDNSIYPVEFNIKEFKVGTDNKLYMSVVLHKTRVDGSSGLPSVSKENPDTAQLSTYSLTDIIKNVNSADVDFLKYIPDELLYEEQLEGKAIGVEKERLKIDDMRYEFAVGNGKKERVNELLKQQAERNGYNWDNINETKTNEVTYDDNGNLIPLSKRYDRYNSDVKFSDMESDNVAAADGEVKTDVIDSNNTVDRLLRSERTEFVNKLSELMGIPYVANRDVLKPLFNAAWAEYKETGRVSQETVNNSIKKDLSRDKSFDYFKVLLYQSL